LVPIAKTRPVISAIEDYYDWLRPHCSAFDVWMTTYVHALDGPAGIADWFAGSALRPFLEPLNEEERDNFLARYIRELEHAYRSQPDGKTLLAYPRLFIVATKR
jgi:trans-aconitate 2-methyltransferase